MAPRAAVPWHGVFASRAEESQAVAVVLPRVDTWAVFFEDRPCGVPRVPRVVPPMVLMMLNTAIVELPLNVDGRPRSRVLPAERSVPPNWWRSFGTRAPELVIPSLLVRRLRCFGMPESRFGPALLGTPASRTLRWLSVIGPTSSFLEDFLPVLPRLQSVEFFGAGTHAHLWTDQPYEALDLRRFDLGALHRHLTTVEVKECDVEDDGLVGLERIRTLLTLRIFNCKNVTAVNHLSACTSLQSLELSEVEVTTEGIEGLERIPTLTRLHLRWCFELRDVTCLATCPSLVELDLRGSAVTSVGVVGLERILTLRRLRLRDCESIGSVACLSSSTSIDSLNLSGCVGVYTLSGLECIPTLTTLRLRANKQVTHSLGTLSTNASLVYLDLEESDICNESLVGVERIRTLRYLKLVSCESLTSVRCLATCAALERLDLSYSGVTTEGISGLECIATLTVLRMRHCSAVTKVDSLASSASLESVDIAGSGVSVDDAKVLEQIPTLRCLRFHRVAPARRNRDDDTREEDDEDKVRSNESDDEEKEKEGRRRPDGQRRYFGDIDEEQDHGYDSEEAVEIPFALP